MSEGGGGVQGDASLQILCMQRDGRCGQGLSYSV